MTRTNPRSRIRSQQADKNETSASLDSPHRCAVGEIPKERVIFGEFHRLLGFLFRLVDHSIPPNVMFLFVLAPSDDAFHLWDAAAAAIHVSSASFPKKRTLI
jgi:hypothetical protein